MQVHYGEGVANHADPESCAACREVCGEALTGERAGQPLSHEIFLIRDADVVTYAEGKTNGCDVAERWIGNCRRDLIDHIIVVNERHLKRLMNEYISYCHEDRTHLALEKRTPAGRHRANNPDAGSMVRPHSALGYKRPAPEAWLTTTNKGHGEVETASRFPLLYTPDGGYLNSEINALH